MTSYQTLTFKDPALEAAYQTYQQAIYDTMQSQFLASLSFEDKQRYINIEDASNKSRLVCGNSVAATSILYCDGGHNRCTGDCAWGSVVDSCGRDILESYAYILSDMKTQPEILPPGRRLVIVVRFSDVASQQNNGAELLACIAALRIASIDPTVKIIRCDSKLIVDYWSVHLKVSSRQKLSAEKVKFIDELIRLATSFRSRGGVIQKISGDSNLADLGYHK